MTDISKIRSLNIVYIGFEDMSIHNLLWGLVEINENCRAYDIGHCISDSFEDYEKLISYIKEAPTDVVFSQNFSPVVSKVCNELSIPYAAWTYDMPLSSLHHQSIFNDCNYIFSFDKDQVNFLKAKGVSNVYHFPLASNPSRSALINITDDDIKKYSCDVSFVGNIMHKKWKDIYNDYLSLMSESEAGSLSDIADNSFGIWDGKNRIRDSITPDLLSVFKKYSSGIPDIDEKIYYESVISFHVSSLEREYMLKSLIPFNVHHYSKDNHTPADGIISHPALNYDNELPKLYFLSKINMSTTLHTISSGVPLRVFDILGMCSLCITNYQPEIEELFEIDKDLVVYNSLDEIPALVNYYLSHENERLKIAANGYQKVSNCYTWAKGAEKILSIIF